MKRRVYLLLPTIVCLWLTAIADGNLQYTLTRARQLHDKHEYAASAKLLDKYIYNASGNLTSSDSADIIAIYRLQGDNFYNLGVTSRAADLYEQALKIADGLGRKKSAAELSNELFIIHLNSGNTALSKDLLTRALELYRSLDDEEGICKILNNLGILYYKLKDYDQSLYYYKKSLEVSSKDSAMTRNLSSTILTNIAETYSQISEYSTAKQYLDRAIELNHGRYDTAEALQAWLNKATVEFALGDRETARKILKNIGSSIKSDDPYLLKDHFTQLANLHLELGDSIQGLRWGLRALALADSLHTKEENEQLRQLLIRYNSERIADHNKMLELDVKRQKILNYVMISIILLSLVGAIFLIYKIRVDRRKNRLIRTQREQLIEFQRQEHERKEREYREELDYKNRQLTSYSIDAASISELHKIILDSLKRLRSGAPADTRSEINEDIALLQNFNRNDVNEDFRVYFNEVHPDLLKRLSEKYPALTSNDLRLCSYLYLGMSTKEIAALTFREIRSVESSRLRLRKKLGLQGDQTLHDFLRAI